MGYRKARLVTAIIMWCDRIQGDEFIAEVLLLYADGTVWKTMARQKRDGPIHYDAGKKHATLPALAHQFKKDLEGMGQLFRTMYFKRNPHFEIVSPIQLEVLRSF